AASSSEDMDAPSRCRRRVPTSGNASTRRAPFGPRSWSKLSISLRDSASSTWRRRRTPSRPGPPGARLPRTRILAPSSACSTLQRLLVSIVRDRDAQRAVLELDPVSLDHPKRRLGGGQFVGQELGDGDRKPVELLGCQLVAEAENGH